MKTILALLILFCAIALPALGELIAQDLEKIRQIVKESETALTSRIEKVDSKVDTIETRLRTVETGVAELRGRSIGSGVLRDWLVTICAISAFIISIFVLVKAQPKAPQTKQASSKAVSQ
jgi:predicted PurR-regulated permease PerM